MKGMTNSIAPGNGAVPRAALAQDALYSPMKTITADYTIIASDLGKTLMQGASAGTGAMTVTIPDDVALSLPFGAEIAIFRRRGTSLTIIFGSETYSTHTGATSFALGKRYTIPEMYGMVAIKKVDASAANGYWLVTGNVEVVS